MTHQTAVDRLKKELQSYGDSQFMIIDWHSLNGMFEKSKEMEKNQISEAYRTGVEEDVYVNPLRTGEMYYNDTYEEQTNSN